MLEDIVNSPDSDEEVLLSKIPVLTDDKRMEFLQFRAVGFSFTEASELVGVQPDTVRKWRKTDKTFKRLEEEYLPELQRTIGPEIMRLKFMRTMLLYLETDLEVAARVRADLENVTDRELDIYHRSRKFYSPEQLLQLDKAMRPEAHKETQIVVLSWDNGERSIEMLPEGDVVDASSS